MTALFLQGNSRDVLKNLPADYFHCCTTSPPYFGLRRYEGGDTEIWDGAENCEHDWVERAVKPKHRSGETNPGKEYYTKPD